LDKTRFDLAAADDLRDSTINVDVDNDVVTLTARWRVPLRRRAPKRGEEC
jgi:hypothetical protein